MRVWLHRWEGDEQGWSAWSLDHLGFATWAPSRTEVLKRVPVKYGEYRLWLEQCGAGTSVEEAGAVEVVEEIIGDEVAFQDDLAPATAEEVSRCIHLLQCTRRGLLEAVAPLSDDVLDWDPPYRRFAPFAWWKSVRQVVEHVALTEVGYYLPSVGWRPAFHPQALREMAWQDQLRVSRQETLRFLEELSSSSDRARVRETDEVWSVRKVLRRLVWHERLHWKSIRRIVREYDRSHRA
ncbi:DinB family protein [Limnochorda pilosa]|uniref:DinB-like domain-containing protein n=1 Tax=Limnochorda pilosa TaxID=1555112 RepID=A0A0K2SIB9_LIMPI|nr:DinB family protein [Limnochorda pilosa]BAS26762.1 hypothetical protein LIP_0905 [Limnochorda pilosa]